MLKRNTAIGIGILGGSMALAQNIVHQPVHPDGVTVIHTALDHVSIITLPEKIQRVAAGSDAIQIEWHDKNVFIKPVKSGQATNLMVWTEHQFSTYELESPGDVHTMTFVLDESQSPLPQAAETAPAQKPSPDEVQRATDSAIGSTLLEVSQVTSRAIRAQKNCVTVLIKEVVHDSRSVYVRFAVVNNSPHPYRIIAPNVLVITPRQNGDLVGAMKDQQIADQELNRFETIDTAQVPVRVTAVPQKDVAPGETREGVLAFEPSATGTPCVYEFVFGNDGNHPIKAMAVL
jgi:hypothetical protein